MDSYSSAFHAQEWDVGALLPHNLLDVYPGFYQPMGEGLFVFDFIIIVGSTSLGQCYFSILNCVGRMANPVMEGGEWGRGC